MEEIRSSQTQPPSSACSAASHESSDDPVSAPTTIDERVIANQVLGVRRGHCKGVRRIIKGRKKASDTPSSSIVTGLSEQSTQQVEEHRLLHELVDAQQHELEVLKAFITQTIRPPLPPPPPPPRPLPPPSSDDAEDLHRD